MGLREAFGQIFGGWFGDVWPLRGPEPLPPKDARQHALDALKAFLGELEFQHPDTNKSFTVGAKNVFTHQPPNPDLLPFPSLAVMPARGHHDQFSLGPADEVDGTQDKFARGTCLITFGEYVESFTIESWSGHDAQRTAMIAGITTAVRMGEWSNALFLALPDYYGVVARFTLVDSEHIDDPDVVRGRVRGHVYMLLEVPEVQLVDAETFKPHIAVNVRNSDEV
jgi:hypothetical protein